MSERPASGRAQAPLWAGTCSILKGKYYEAPSGIAVRAHSAHVAARLAVAQVRAKLPARSRVTGFVLKLERQPTPKVAKTGAAV